MIGLSIRNIFLILSSRFQSSLICQILNNVVTFLYKFVLSLLENHTSNPKVKPSYQQSDKRKDDETASSIISARQAGRNTYFSSSEPRRSAYVFYRNVTDVQEPKFNGSMGEFLLTQNS